MNSIDFTIMKQLFILTLLSIAIFAMSCGGDSSNKDFFCDDYGIVMSYDETECACCPGWEIVINGADTIKVFSMPIEEELWDIVNTTGFPVEVNIEASRESGSCSDFYHDIFCVEIR